MTIHENLSTPVTARCDVLVCGGGVAGAAAALAAAREGASVILLEMQYLLGGLGTAGLVTIYLPLCDGMGRQVSFGLAEELFRLSIRYGAEAQDPSTWLDGKTPHTDQDPRFQTQYNPQLFAILLGQLLHENGVQVLYGTEVVAVHKEQERIAAVMIQNASGRQAIAVRSVVDATGDAAVAALAGVPTAVCAQPNALAAWYYSVGAKTGYQLRMQGVIETAADGKTALARSATQETQGFTGLRAEEQSQFMRLSQQAILQDVLRLRQQDPTLFPVTMPTLPTLRMTRRLVGAYALDLSDEHTDFPDSIGMVGNWRKRGPVYEVPFRTLYSPVCPNLLCVGRCASSTEAMWDILRVIPCCAVTGQAAGCAAACTADFPALDVSLLQSRLVAAGVRLHESDLPPR